MSTPSNTTERLKEIERILAHRKASTPDGNAEAVAVHLADVPAARISELTSTLRRRAGEPVDDIDAVTMRLLLNDYTMAVEHLRAVARDAAARVDAAAIPIKAMRRAVKSKQPRDEESITR